MNSTPLKRLILIVVSSLGSLLLLEWCVRQLRPQPTYSTLGAAVESHYAESDFNTFTLKPNYRGTERSQEQPSHLVSVTINALGLRGPELGPRRTNQILILGDSYTFGLFVENDETYPAQLQSMLDRHHIDAQVINAGYADGFDTDQQYSWFKHVGLTLHPTVTLLGFFLGNDIDGIDFSAWQSLDEFGLPTRYQSDKYVDTWGRVRSRQDDQGAVGIEWFYRIPILRESHAFVLAGKGMDRLIHREDTSGYWDEDFAHIFGEFSGEFLEKEQAAVNLIDGMGRNARAAGSAFAVVLIPINFMVDADKLPLVVEGSRHRRVEADYYDRFSKLLAARGVASINIGALI